MPSQGNTEGNRFLATECFANQAYNVCKQISSSKLADKVKAITQAICRLKLRGPACAVEIVTDFILPTAVSTVRADFKQRRESVWVRQIIGSAHSKTFVSAKKVV